MVQASIIEYLKTARLGPLASMCPRESVHSLLGSPPYWDGWGGIPCEASQIWVYDSIQLSFDDAFRLEDTLVSFDATYRGSAIVYADWDNSYVTFDDLNLDAICTPDLFLGAMAANGIAAEQRRLFGDRVLIDTRAGVQARFGMLTEPASRERETPIRSPLPYLHILSTVKLTD